MIEKVFLNSDKDKKIDKERPKSIDNFIDEKLVGKIFHITSSKNLKSIKSTGIIKAITSVNSFSESEVSYGRIKKWVCLFDLRNKTKEQIIDTKDKCLRSLLSRIHKNSVVLVVDKSYYQYLKFQMEYTNNEEFDSSCYISREEIVSIGSRVPYTECWCPRNMCYKEIENIIITQFPERSKSSRIIEDIYKEADSIEDKIYR